MTSLLRQLAPAVIALATIGFSAMVSAQSTIGSITYGPGSNAVPTLGGSALILLAVLLAVMAFRAKRSQQRQGVNLVVALTAIASGVGGINLVSDAQAGISIEPFFIELDSAGGGTEPLVEGLNLVLNSTGVPQKILSIELSGECSTAALPDVEAASECDDNPATVLASDESPASACGLAIDCGDPD